MYDKDTVFDALAIRDTATKTSDVSNNQGFVPKTIAINNALNQAVTLQLQGTTDSSFTNVYDIGAPFVIAASTLSYQNTETYFPFFRLTAVCAIAPTTGTLTVTLLKVE